MFVYGVHTHEHNMHMCIVRVLCISWHCQASPLTVTGRLSILLLFLYLGRHSFIWRKNCLELSVTSRVEKVKTAGKKEQSPIFNLSWHLEPMREPGSMSEEQMEQAVVRHHKHFWKRVYKAKGPVERQWGRGRRGEPSNLPLRFFSRWQTPPNAAGVQTTVLGSLQSRASASRCSLAPQFPVRLWGWQSLSALHPLV